MLEKEANTAAGTNAQIYPVEFTQDVFNRLIDSCVAYTDSITANQPCNERNCTVILERNPQYDRLAEICNSCSREDTRLNNLLDSYLPGDPYYQQILDDIASNEAAWDRAYRELLRTPEFIEHDPICNSLHDYHGVALHFYSCDEVMSALGFSEADIEWVRLTEIGFEMNPDIP